MTEAVHFPFLDADTSQSGASLMPLLPFTLSRDKQEVAVLGLLDTGAAVNVLPYPVGEQLGFNWRQQHVSVTLSGNLALYQARGIVITANVASFPPIRLAFAWTQTDDIRLILGQANFFHEFDVCFFRSRSEFEIRTKQLG